MTVTNENVFWAYTGDGAQTIFAYDNIVWEATDLRVELDDVVQPPTEYSVTGLGQSTGGTVVFNTAPGNGVAVEIISNIPYTQETDYELGKVLPPETKETALDRLCRLVQQAAAIAITSGGGDVIGPAGATDNAVARFDGATGKQIKNSNAIITDAGDATFAGTVNGRNIATDGAKLDGIEAGAQVNTVTSVFGRMGAVVAGPTDYDADLIAPSATRIWFTPGEQSKLAGIEAAAQVNTIESLSNLGTGEGTVFAGLVAKDGTFRSLRAGTNVTITQDGNEITINSAGGGGGSGDVVGPASATDDALARFDGTTGKLIQNSNAIVTDLGNATFAGTVNGRDMAADGTKLDGIDAGAQANDGANIGAGAGQVYRNKTGATLNFATLASNNDIDVFNNADTITFSHVNNSVKNTTLNNMPGWSIKLRNAGNSGDPSDAASGDVTEDLSPASGDFLLGWAATGELRKFNVGNLPTGGGGEANDGLNVGTAGVGIYDGKSGVTLNFRQLNSLTTALTIVLDGPNQKLDFAIASATVSVAGLMSAADKGKLDGIEAGAQVNTVTSVFSRTGAVAAENGDYSIGQITGTWVPPLLRQGDSISLGFKRSIEMSGDNKLQFVNDTDTPGANAYYGTNGAEQLGYHPLPVNAQFFWTFSNSTVSADPGAGNFRLNAGTWAATTEIYISATTAYGLNVLELLKDLTAGQVISISQSGDPSRAGLFEMSAPATDNGAWLILPVTAISDTGTTLQNNALAAIEFTGIGGSVPDTERGKVRGVEEVTATAYSFVLGDRGKWKRFNNATAQTATVEPSATTNFDIGTTIHPRQVAGGALTIAAGAGVTINAPSGKTLQLRGQHASATLVKVAADEWDLAGDLADV